MVYCYFIASSDKQVVDSQKIGIESSLEGVIARFSRKAVV